MQLYRVSELVHRERVHIIASKSVRRYALVRHPLERGISAFFSKVACGSGDPKDHAHLLRGLLMQVHPQHLYSIAQINDACVLHKPS